jgi:hypothetical protein
MKLGTDASVESRILDAFCQIDGQTGSPALAVLRARLVAELFGDVDAVAATLDPGFELVMHSRGTTLTLPGSAVLKGVETQKASGVLMWSEFDDLVADQSLIAASGRLCSLAVRERALSTMPLGLFLRFTRAHMTSEVAFIGEAQTAVIAEEVMPSVERLRAHLHPDGANGQPATVR